MRTLLFVASFALGCPGVHEAALHGAAPAAPLHVVAPFLRVPVLEHGALGPEIGTCDPPHDSRLKPKRVEVDPLLPAAPPRLVELATAWVPGVYRLGRSLDVWMEHRSRAPPVR